MVRAVIGAFEALEHHTLRFVWITLQVCKVEVLKKLGGIDYHIPHMNKSKLAREGRLLDYLTVRKEIIYESLRHLDAHHLEVALLYLGVDDQEIFHQATQPTTTFIVSEQKNQEKQQTTEPTSTTILSQQENQEQQQTTEITTTTTTQIHQHST